MKKYTLNTFLFFLTINLLSSQNLDSLYVSRVNDTILSKYLNEKRAIEIQLPRSYEIEVDKNYPLMIVLDGDYMFNICLLYTSPSPRDRTRSRMPSSA